MEFFKNLDISDIMISAGAVVFVVFVLAILRKIFRKNRGSRHRQTVACDRCGWEGNVSVYAGKCPSCNKPLGDQKVETYKV